MHSDDEAWLRDDVPSAQWLAGRAVPDTVHVPAGASARNPLSSALAGLTPAEVHEAEAPLSSAFAGITPAEAHEAEASPHG